MSSKGNVQPNFRQDKITFLGRTEQLDWKQIASIDIDNLIHRGDTSQLLELIKPVTFCKADTEFDDGKIRVDPAFIKVFRISQLISEFLLASQEKSIERLADLQEKHNETEKEKEKLSEEILHLKETLMSAKKELKKRKEMLATTQNEMLGENNGDEYDQCPYCSKKFVGPGFLLAHIQRRHQGLPVNPLFPSFPSGSASVVYQHSHPQTPQASQHRHSHHQQTPGSSGIYDPHNISLQQTAQHVQQTLMNHHLFPAVPTPSPSIMYSNNQLLPSNLSFSGSVTSLNNIPFNQYQGPPAATSSINAVAVRGKRESFTQTSNLTNDTHAELKSSSHLELLPEETTTTRRQQEESCHSSDKHSPDSLNQLPSSLHRDSPVQVETLQRPQLPSFPIPTQLVDGSHPTPDGDGDARMVNTSMLRNWERVEATKMDVFRVQNQHETHWSNMEEEKVGQNGTDKVTNAMISETLQETAGFSINSSQSHLREDGEVTKSSAATTAVINHSQYVGEREKEFAELKKLLQASVQGELKSLISRLESQEQFWQDKLASLQQDHERQIQQLRHEVQIQNGTRRNNDNGPVSDENGVVMVNDNFQREREIGDDEKENGKVITTSYSGTGPPPTEIILVEPKDGHHMPQSLHEHHQKFGTSYIGARRDDALDDQDDEDGGESISSTRVPVAKPRKSKVVVATEGKHHQQYHHHQQREEMSRVGTLAQLQSLSDSDPELLAIIQPEELHEGKQGNSILPDPSNDVSGGTSTTATTARVATAAAAIRSKQQQYQHPLSSYRTLLPAANSGLVTDCRGAEKEITRTFPASEIKSVDEVSEYTLSDSVDLDDDDEEHNNDIRAMSSQKNDKQHEKHHQHHHLDSPSHTRGKYSVKQISTKKKYIFDAEARKIVEVSPDDDDDDAQDEEGDEYSENNSEDLNSTSSDDEFTEGKKRKSQLDLVRAKTIMELEQNMSDIGLNPESTAIGMEEMKRALKHFKSQQRATSNDQIHDHEKLEEERNAVKTLVKFEAVKSSIDEKLDAISTLSSKKSQQSSFGKILTAVKSSGKSFGKRVASVVKKKHKSEVSFATSNEILANAKSSEVIYESPDKIAATTEKELKNANKSKERTEPKEISKYSSGKLNLEARKDNDRRKKEISEARLQQIKQIVSKSKEEVTGDETEDSSSEEDSEEELLERTTEEATEQEQSGESKQNYPRERKLAFVENDSDKLPLAKLRPGSNNEKQSRWAATIHMEEGIKQSRQQLQSPRELPVTSRYISPGRISSNTQSDRSASSVFSEISAERRFQFTVNDDDDQSECSNDDRRTNDNEVSPTFSTKNRGNRQSRFLTPSPTRDPSTPSRSSDDVNDLDDLLNTMQSDVEPANEKQQQKKRKDNDNENRNHQTASSEFAKSVKRKPLASGTIMQPTNHHVSGLGMTNLRNRAEAQRKLLFDVGGGRGSPTSRNSWDSQK